MSERRSGAHDVGPLTVADVHEHYRRRVERALAAGRTQLARELADDYLDEALACLTDSTELSPAPGPSVRWRRSR